MLRNRSFRVKMVKDEPEIVSPPIDIDHLANAVTKSVVTVVTAYVGMDILRKAAVYILSAKV